MTRLATAALPRLHVRAHERFHVIAQPLERAQERPQIGRRWTAEPPSLVCNAGDLVEVAPDHPKFTDRAFQFGKLTVGYRRDGTEVRAQNHRCISGRWDRTPTGSFTQQQMILGSQTNADTRAWRDRMQRFGGLV